MTPGGVADRSGLLKQGDQIVSVNGRDFRRINRDEATNILKSIRDEANFVLINKYNGKKKREFAEAFPRRSFRISPIRCSTK